MNKTYIPDCAKLFKDAYRDKIYPTIFKVIELNGTLKKDT